MKINIKTAALIGLLSAMASILMLFPQFPIFPAFGWLDIDFSDVPALFASIVISPLAGGVVVLIKNLIHLAATKTAMIGELANFLIGFSFVISAGILSRVLTKGELARRKLLLVLVLASIVQVIAGVLVNLYIMIPLYAKFVNFEEIGIRRYILAGVIPFNLIKDALVSFTFYLLYRYAYPPISKKMC